MSGLKICHDGLRNVFREQEEPVGNRYTQTTTDVVPLQRRISSGGIEGTAGGARWGVVGQAQWESTGEKGGEVTAANLRKGEEGHASGMAHEQFGDGKMTVALRARHSQADSRAVYRGGATAAMLA